jgi:hypothetical protein
MKRLVPIVLLCIYLCGSGGMYYTFRIVQYSNYLQVRKQIRDNLLSNELTLLIINSKELASVHWKQDGKEFEYRGELYDVSNLVNKKEASYIYCFKDAREKQLLSVYEQKKNNNRQSEKYLTKIQYTACILPQNLKETLPVVEHTTYLFQNEILVSPFADIHSPPPKSLL